jgi:hypothetical protein
MSHRLIQKPGLFMMVLLFTGLQLLTYNSVYAQDDCATKIQEAQKYYDQGMIDEIPQMLAPCMADGFTRQQKIEACHTCSTITSLRPKEPCLSF